MVRHDRITPLFDYTDLSCIPLEYLALWDPICKTDP